MPTRKTYTSPSAKRPEDRLSQVVQVRFTPREFQRLEKLADGRPLAVYVRRIMMEHLPELRRAKQRR